MAAATTRKKTNIITCLHGLLTASLCLVLSIQLGYCDDTPSDCVFGGSDFSLIKKFNPWRMVSEDGTANYTISLCDAIKPIQDSNVDCHSQTSVCRRAKGQAPKSSGNFSKMVAAENTKVSEKTLVLQGDECPEVLNGHYVTMITFQCSLDVGLGSPEFLVYSLCTTYVLWRTNVVCKGVEQAVKEVPCYVYDQQNHKHNLSPLTKKVGGYLVSSEQGWSFFINVCKDLKGGTSAKCPPGSGACRIDPSGTAFGMGDPVEKLQSATGENKFMLHYTTDTDVNGCTAKPSTSIEFRCPSVGGGKDPVLVADFNCQFHVVWETEHACVETDITNNTCRLVKESDDIDIDLTPLTAHPGERMYQVTVHPTNKTGDTYIYYLNVCGELGLQCPDQDHVRNVAACQTKFGDSDYGRVIGSTVDSNQILRYADGDLTLTYRGGDVCYKNNPRTTIINFKCNLNAENMGKGQPVFVKEVNDSCIYMFDWETKYACTGHPANEECRVDYGGHRYDLSPLMRKRKNDKNWEVLHSDQSNSGNEFYLNVCNDLLSVGTAARCHPDASVCLIDQNGPHNLGTYIENPVYSKETKTLQITYGRGDPCGDNKATESIINFVCKPGDLDSGPVLLDTSLDKCLYRFEWQTSAACVLGHWTGDNCHVFDKEAGFNFDLSPLTLTSGSYNVWDKNRTYEYQINVCDAVHGTKCDSSNTPTLAGVCQTKGGEHAINTGQASSHLEYYDGMINLTYTNGQVYNSHPPVPRKTEIVFLCDQTVGKGSPTFVDETNNGYSFEWYTSYACPNEPVECIITDEKNHQQYDLSSLSKSESQDNWELMDDSDPNNKLKYYINVCHSLNQVHVGKGCSTFAGACRTSFKTGKEVVDMVDLGEVISPPRVENKGQLSLKYRSRNQTCLGINGQKTYYTTSIHFICSRGALVTGPSTVQQLGNCDFVYIWTTEAACPIEMTVSSTNCSIKDRNSDYIFNVGLLTRKGDTDYYQVVGSGTNIYRINICGTVSSTHCAPVEGKPASMCQVLPNVTQGLSFLKYNLDYDNDGKLMLKYEGKRLDDGRRIEVRVLFLCRQNVDTGEPKFDHIDEDYKYIFTFETSLACKPDAIDCLAEDLHGNQYDLSPLARGASDANWQVLDTRDNHKDLTYHINVCRPVNSAGTSCPGGPVGGCQVSNTGSAFNMGYIHSQPMAAEDGTVTLHYRNGDLCHKNTSKESHRSTRIIFTCSGVEHNPVFIGETEFCEYAFSWQTPYACPIKQAHIGQNCRVRDPLNTYEFDLTPLRRATDYAVTTRDYKYILNVCGPLKNPICGDAQAGACQTKTGDATYKVNTGMASSALRYQTGVITLKYEDGKANCHGMYNRTTIITFLCDHAASGATEPIFINETSKCTYLFEWKTNLACPPFKVGDCSVADDNGNQYDLSNLAMTSQNYDYIDYIHSKKFIINVCRSLVHGKDQTCPYNAAACMINLEEHNDTKRFHNLGEVSEHQVIVENGQLEIHYVNGEPCASGGRTSTRILLYCNRDTLFSHPVGHFTVDDCEHDFTWNTQAACRINVGPAAKGDNCTATNPATGYVFDLSSLNKANPYIINDNRGHALKVNVCGKLSGSKCHGDSVGACQVEVSGQKRKFNSGNYNARLQYDRGVLVLNYTGGDDCHQNAFKRNTIINFVCSKTAGTGYPVYIDETADCTYYISWHTSLACEEEVICSVDNGNTTIDLSPLVKSTGQYMALSTTTGRNTSYYINICRPLNPIYGTLCPPQASACMLPRGGKPQSLGKVKSRPHLENGKVTLVYEGGDKCLTDTTKNMSTKLIFICNRGATRSSPVLQEVSDCRYVFLWDTAIVCERDDTTLQPTSQECSFKDPQTDNVFDLSSFKTAHKPYQITRDGYTYRINICDKVVTSLPGCETAGVCRTNQTMGFSFGNFAQRKFSKTGNVIQLTYSQGATCGADNRKSESVITFDCDTSGAIGDPKYSYAGQCQALFYWKTCEICPTAAGACSLGYNYHSYDLSMLSSETGGWNLTDSKGNRYWINICQSVTNGPASLAPCPHMVAAWRQTPSGQVDRLGLISTQKLTMDTDGKTLILRYTQGGPVCPHTKRRSNNIAAQTVIKFECGKTVGGPRFVERPDQNDCVFEFHWKSKVACSLISQTVKDKDGSVTDPETGSVVNLNNLGASKVSVGANSYYDLDFSGHAGKCTDSVVCLHNGTDQNIGSFSKRTFSFEDGILEAAYETNTICIKDRKKKVKAIITIHCNENTYAPQLLSRSRDCVHMFMWETPVACLHPVVEIPQPSSLDHTVAAAASANKGKTVATVMAVFIVAILVCVLLIVFHRKERRDACFQMIRRKTRKDTEYRYTIIPDALQDGDDEDILGAANNTSEPDEAQSINAISTENEPSLTSYHDDSDVDLLE